MAGQSFAMGEAFGKGFQYGKRRISAMDNKEFNKMSAKDHFVETTADIKSMIPEMKQAMSSFAFLQQDIIKELLGYIKDTTGTVIEEIHETGTELAQQSLDGLRAIVGLPPIYAKLVSPPGINALIKYWGDAGILPGLKSSNDIWAAIKKIFNVSPPTNTVTEVFKWIQTNLGGTFIGPPVPPGGIIPPPTKVFDKDIRKSGGESGSLKAPSSIITQFNKYNAEIRALSTIKESSPQKNWSWAAIAAKFAWGKRMKFVHQQMLNLWSKYDLVGKVNSGNYSTRASGLPELI